VTCEHVWVQTYEASTANGGCQRCWC
jgi:hypothetical protein